MTWIQSLSQEDLLEEGTATHSSMLTWRIPWTEEPGRLQSIGLQRVRHDWSNLTWHSTSHCECLKLNLVKWFGQMPDFNSNKKCVIIQLMRYKLSVEKVWWQSRSKDENGSYWAKKGKAHFCYSCFVLCAYGCPGFLELFVAKMTFAALNCLCSFVKDQFTMFMWTYFWAVYSLSFIYLFIPLIIPPCLLKKTLLFILTSPSKIYQKFTSLINICQLWNWTRTKIFISWVHSLSLL